MAIAHQGLSVVLIRGKGAVKKNNLCFQLLQTGCALHKFSLHRPVVEKQIGIRQPYNLLDITLIHPGEIIVEKNQ
ncbi:hypothetical protein ES703_123879 [subsurface metagenome]